MRYGGVNDADGDIDLPMRLKNLCAFQYLQRLHRQVQETCGSGL